MPSEVIHVHRRRPKSISRSLDLRSTARHTHTQVQTTRLVVVRHLGSTAPRSKVLIWDCARGSEVSTLCIQGWLEEGICKICHGTKIQAHVGVDHPHRVSMTGTTKVHSSRMVNDWHSGLRQKRQINEFQAALPCPSTEVEMGGIRTSKKRNRWGMSIDYCFIAYIYCFLEWLQ